MIKNNLRQRPYLLRGLDGVYRGKRLRRAVYPAIINYKAQGVKNMTIQVNYIETSALYVEWHGKLHLIHESEYL